MNVKVICTIFTVTHNALIVARSARVRAATTIFADVPLESAVALRVSVTLGKLILDPMQKLTTVDLYRYAN